MGQRNAYKLGLSLRNTSAVEVAMPWVELSLTDASGALLARRVFPPDGTRAGCGSSRTRGREVVLCLDGHAIGSRVTPWT